MLDSLKGFLNVTLSLKCVTLFRCIFFSGCDKDENFQVRTNTFQSVFSEMLLVYAQDC